MPWERGFDFRSSASYVDDRPPNTSANSANFAYPQRTNGVTFGWTTGTGGLDFRDRDNTVDRRLAGMNFVTDGSPSVFRVDLPGPGLYDVRLAMGDASNGFTGQNLAISDGATGATLLSIGPVSTAGGSFADSTGAVYTAAEWPGRNRPVRLSLAGPLLLSLGPQAAGSVSTIAHLSLRRVERSTVPRIAAVVAASGGSAGNASGTAPSVSLSAPSGSATGAASASATAPSVSLSAPSGTATGAASASGTAPAVSLSAPAGSASGGSSSPGNASGTAPSVSVGVPAGSATGSASATGSPPAVSLSAQAGQATGAASATGTAPSVSLSAPAGSAAGGGVAPRRRVWPFRARRMPRPSGPPPYDLYEACILRLRAVVPLAGDWHSGAANPGQAGRVHGRLQEVHEAESYDSAGATYAEGLMQLSVYAFDRATARRQGDAATAALKDAAVVFQSGRVYYLRPAGPRRLIPDAAPGIAGSNMVQYVRDFAYSVVS